MGTVTGGDGFDLVTVDDRNRVAGMLTVTESKIEKAGGQNMENADVLSAPSRARRAAT